MTTKKQDVETLKKKDLAMQSKNKETQRMSSGTKSEEESEIIKEGYLKKLSTNGLRWQQRYFRITFKNLEYTEFQTNKEWKTIELGNSSEIYTTDRYGQFQLGTSERKIQLKANSMNEAASWVTVLREQAKIKEHIKRKELEIEEDEQTASKQEEFKCKTIEQQEKIVQSHLDLIFEDVREDMEKLLNQCDHALDELEMFLLEIHDVPATATLVCAMFYHRILRELAFIESIDMECQQDKITMEQCIRPVAVMYRFNVLRSRTPEEKVAFQQLKCVEHSRRDKLLVIYLKKIASSIESCCTNLIARSEQEMKEFENFCVKSLSGYNQTTLSIDLSRMLQEYTEVASSAGEVIFTDQTVDVCLLKLINMQKEINSKFHQITKDKEEHQNMEFWVAKINDYAECMVVVEGLQNVYSEATDMNCKKIDELSHQFVNAAVGYMDCILDMMYRDVNDIVQTQLFRVGWEDGNAIATIVCTFRDYFDELQQTMNKAFFNSIIKRSALRTVQVYIQGMIGTYKDISRKAGKYKYREHGITQVEKDYQALVLIYGSYVPHKYFIEDLQVIKDMYHFLKCSFDEIIMSFECVVRQNQNCFLEVLDALRLCLKLRPHLNQGMRKTILANCLTLSSTYYQPSAPSLPSKSLYKKLFPDAGIKHCTGVPWSLSITPLALPSLRRSQSTNEYQMPNLLNKNETLSKTPRASFKDAFLSPKFNVNSQLYQTFLRKKKGKKVQKDTNPIQSTNPVNINAQVLRQPVPTKLSTSPNHNPKKKFSSKNPFVHSEVEVEVEVAVNAGSNTIPHHGLPNSPLVVPRNNSIVSPGNPFI